MKTIKRSTTAGELIITVDGETVRATLAGAAIDPTIRHWINPIGGLNGPVGTIGGNVALYEAELTTILMAVALARFVRRPSTKTLRGVGRATRRASGDNQSQLINGVKALGGSLAGFYGFDVLAAKAAAKAAHMASNDYDPALDGPASWHRAVMSSLAA